MYQCELLLEKNKCCTVLQKFTIAAENSTTKIIKSTANLTFKEGCQYCQFFNTRKSHQCFSGKEDIYKLLNKYSSFSL